MLNPKNVWPNTENSFRVLFFAQLVRELLDPETFESHRVFSLDTLSRLNECASLYKDFQSGRISKKTLNAPFEEACWSVRADPVVSDVFSEIEIDTVCSELSKTESFSDPYSGALYLRNRLIPIYKSHMEEQILSLLSQESQKNRLRQLTSFYCSHLINIGYSRDYISEVCDRVFFDADHGRISSTKVSRFFENFSAKIHDYDVYAEVSKDTGKLLKGLGATVLTNRSNLGRTSADVKAKFAIDTKNRYAVITCKAMDEFSATASANELLEDVRALALLNPEAADITWRKEFYVVRKRKQAGAVLKLPENPLDWLSPQPSSRPRLIKDITRYSERVLSNFDSNSMGRILRSVSTAASSRNASTVETQLITLWSAVEGLLVEPPDGRARIEHFADLIVPCICNRHLHRRSIYIFEQMKIMYGSAFLKIVTKEPDWGVEHEHFKFTRLFMFEKNHSLRQQLCNLARDNPLALHRMYQFYNDVKNPMNIHSSLLSHEKRVRWQIGRIYRVRNSLVHKIDRPGYLDSVVLNMFEYYIRLLACIVRTASKYQGQSDLDQTVSGIFLDTISTKSLIKTKFEKNENDDSIFISLLDTSLRRI